jgi:hypothetical protein
MSKHDIAVDVEFLAKCLGLKAWPEWSHPGAEPGPAYLNNWHQRAAARAITDAMRPDSITGKVYADGAIHNATAWIDRAYEAGKRDGIEMERRDWERKIALLFGLRMRPTEGW